MTRSLLRSLVLALVAVLVGSAALLGSPAEAASLGGLLIFPGRSIDTAAIRVYPQHGCPSQADGYNARLFGHGFPADGLVAVATTDVGMSHTSGFYVHFAQTMRDFAADNHTTLQGTYTVTVYCVDSFKLTSFGEFTGQFAFASATRYAAVGAAMPTATPSDAALEQAQQPSGIIVAQGDESASPQAAGGTRDRGLAGSGDNTLPIVIAVIASLVALLAVADRVRSSRRAAAATPKKGR